MLDVRLCEHLDEIAPPLTLEEIRHRPLDKASVTTLPEIQRVQVSSEVAARSWAPRSGGRRWRGLAIATAGVAAVVIGALALANIGVREQVTETNSETPNIPDPVPSTVIPPSTVAASPPDEASVAGPLILVSLDAGLTVDQMIEQIADQHPVFTGDELRTVVEEGEIESEFIPADRSSFEQLDGFRTIYEGMLGAGRYQLQQELSAEELMQLLATTMEQQVASARFDVGDGPESSELSSYELLIVASLIESEAVVDADRQRIARVIYNRLSTGMALGLDSTAVYAANKSANELVVDDLNSSSPFNTRNTSSVGLPPTPIAAPGPDSIRAALSPAEGDWLFYVQTNEGGIPGAFTFANNEQEFQEAVEICRERNLGC